MAAVSTVALAFTAPGQTMLVSLLNLPLREAFSLEPLVLNASYTIATMLAALPLVWVGKLTDRLGPRKMLMFVAAAFGGACLLTASVAHVSMVMLAFFLLRFLGQGSLSVVSNHALAMWFHARLGTISGFRQVLVFAAWTPLPTATLWLIDAHGFRFTWAMFGLLIPCVLCLLSWRFVRDRPEDLGLKIDGLAFDERKLGSKGGAQQVNGEPPSVVESEAGLTFQQAFRTSAYWILVTVGVLPPMIGTALLFDVQPLLQSRGLSGETAAMAVSVWTATMAISAIPGGRLVDAFPPRWLIVAGVTTLGLSCLLWLGVSTAMGAFVASAVCAAGQSLIAGTASATTARYFGRRHHGEIRSSLTRLNILATGLGPLVFGLSLRATAGYETALSFFVALCAPAAVAAAWLSPPSER